MSLCLLCTQERDGPHHDEVGMHAGFTGAVARQMLERLLIVPRVHACIFFAHPRRPVRDPGGTRLSFSLTHRNK